MLIMTTEQSSIVNYLGFFIGMHESILLTCTKEKLTSILLIIKKDVISRSKLVFIYGISFANSAANTL